MSNPTGCNIYFKKNPKHPSVPFVFLIMNVAPPSNRLVISIKEACGEKVFRILLRLIEATSLGVFGKYMCLGTQSIDEGVSRDVVNIHVGTF
jgi:hypothetical protein